MATWETAFESALKTAAAKANVDITGLAWTGCTTDQTWGDRVGLVFYGASDAANERAAKFFETWASKHMSTFRKSGYDAQASISFAGEFEFTRFSNGVSGWHKVAPRADWELAHRASNPPVETKRGFATSYVYYPCAE